VTGTPTGVANPAPPAAPGTPLGPPDGFVTFADNSDNESGFEIQRATSMSGPFTTVALLPPHRGTGDVTFIDPAAVPAGSHFFYRAIAHSAGYGDSTSGVGPVPLPGDFNNDGRVSFTDLLILARNFGQAGGLQQGDANGDGTVDFADVIILATHYGKGRPSPALALHVKAR
jgi:hypothetical protein